jgi:hypothetical protein
MYRISTVLALAALFTWGSHAVVAQGAAQPNQMRFFITSVGSGNGANLGGLAGADQHCQMLAKAAGAGNRTWRAYLSASASANQPAVNARDRIGQGPWTNIKGVTVAQNVDQLHSDKNNLTRETQLTEKGDSPPRHDILTGSQLDGRAFPAGMDKTCGNWTSSGQGSGRLGHYDRQGGGENPSSWNSAHDSRGCSQDNLRSTGGDGLFYCFATN